MRYGTRAVKLLGAAQMSKRRTDYKQADVIRTQPSSLPTLSMKMRVSRCSRAGGLSTLISSSLASRSCTGDTTPRCQRVAH